MAPTVTDIITDTITWHHLTIKISFNPSYCSFGTYADHPLAHLQIKALSPESARLPMSSTSYKSHFVLAEAVADYGTATDYVRAWLEDAALCPKWQAYMADQQQLSLF